MTDDQGKRPVRPNRPVPRRPKPKNAPAAPAPQAKTKPQPKTKPQTPSSAEVEIVEAVVVDAIPATENSARASNGVRASLSTIAVPVSPSAMPQNPEAEVVDGADEESSAGFLLFTAMPSWLASTIVHVIVLLLLAMAPGFVNRMASEPDRELVISNVDDEPGVEELEDFEPAEDIEMEDVEIETSLPAMDADTPVEEFEISPANDLSAAAARVEIDPAGVMSAPANLLTTQTVGAMSGDALAGRGQASRKRMVREGGGNAASEAAVMMALEWLAQHQMPDGGWHLDHRLGQCQGRCKHPGERTPARFGATGLALLPFLGAGNTHVEGPYKEVVARGLQYLVRNIKIKGPTGRLTDEGNYYSHGLCTIALCEAFAMSKDKSLMAPAQSLVNEIIVSQDRLGGGWRYQPRQAGDTSVLGWLVMGLKSADMAYLQIDGNSLKGARLFLDSVQHEDGARYRYVVAGPDGKMRENPTSTMSAVGLLMRMYMGWDRENEVLQAGVARLAKSGPSVGSKPNMYYNYYGTQVMHHFHKPEDKAWEKWNEKMRDYLVESQEKEGHPAGSWHFDGDAGHAKAGGRLYETSMSTMILEVYYRHMPLYQSEASEDDFQL